MATRVKVKAVVHARINRADKVATEKVLGKLGMTPSDAIRLFYKQIQVRNGFPLELRVPNKLTAATLDKSDRNEEIESFDNVQDLYASWQ